MDTQPVNRWLSKSEIVTRYGISPRTFERWLKTKRFPTADFRLPGGQPRWSNTAVEAHERNAVSKKGTA
jgi:predicted DNA-binding transcriptional regulator AlpA